MPPTLCCRHCAEIENKRVELPVELNTEAELTREIARLRAELARREREAADKELQLERYAADLRDTFKQERALTRRLTRSYRATVRALSNAVEARDAYTGKHAERVAAYGIEIARAVGMAHPDAPEMEFGFLLHDIGKVAVPDSILYKPGPLTTEERALMARHPAIGAEIVSGIEFLAEASEVVRSHHERWDGMGYPDGLAGEQIPVAARVFAVADVLDALTTDRPYRTGFSLDEARAMIVEESGSHFDPDVIDAFRTIEDRTFVALGEAA
jgi:putative nucleotidyltransferase with HDIG domain